MKRRDFLKAAALTSATVAYGCHKKDDMAKLTTVPDVTAEQAKNKRRGRSSVALVEVSDYDRDIFSRLEPFIDQAGLPSLKDKRVLIKPNMVEYVADRPVHTNPLMVKAVIDLARHLGARDVVVGEGPGHMRDTEYLLESTGLGKMLAECETRFVDLNLDDLVKVPNRTSFNGLDHIYLPKTVVEADAVISAPKLKMHHWVGVTCSMKNLFGTVPGRKYGWPKNILHIKGITTSIVDLVDMIRPSFAVVDAIVAMEGDGPINGTALKTGFVALGTDLAAVDATCVRITSVNPHALPYLNLAGKVIGNIEEEKIDIAGATIESLKKPFEQPITLKDKSLLARARNAGS